MITKKKTKKPARTNDLAAKVRAYFHAKSAGIRGYQRADRLLQEIARRSKPGKEIRLDHRGRKAILRDRFSEKDLIWTPCAARRWDLEIIEP